MRCPRIVGYNGEDYRLEPGLSFDFEPFLSPTSALLPRVGNPAYVGRRMTVSLNQATAGPGRLASTRKWGTGSAP
jgi:hypothetical protein